MELAAFIEAAKANLGLDLTPNTSGVSAVRVPDGDDKRTLTLEWTPVSVHLYTSIGSTVPLTMDDTRALLSANLFGAGTYGCTIATDPILKQILVTYTLALKTLDVRTFLEAIANVVDCTRRWRQWMQKEHTMADISRKTVTRRKYLKV